MSEVPLAAVPLQAEAESATFDTAEDADSKSKEGETDPPDNKTSGWYTVNCPVVLHGGERGDAFIWFFGLKIRKVVWPGKLPFIIQHQQNEHGKSVPTPPSPPPLTHCPKGWQS